MEAYRSFGLLEDEIYQAFKWQTMCMIASEKKIKKLTGFFVSKLKIKPSLISKNPNLLLLGEENYSEVFISATFDFKEVDEGRY